MRVVLWVLVAVGALLLIAVGTATWKAVRVVRRRRTLPLAVPAHEPWPDLPTAGFVTGRIATQQDVEAGNAVFAATSEPGEPGSTPGASVPLEIPQFALLDDRESGTLVRVVAIQAERVLGRDIVGYRRIDDGRLGAGMRQEFTFAGREPALTEDGVRRDLSVRVRA